MSAPALALIVTRLSVDEQDTATFVPLFVSQLSRFGSPTPAPGPILLCTLTALRPLGASVASRASRADGALRPLGAWVALRASRADGAFRPLRPVAPCGPAADRPLQPLWAGRALRPHGSLHASRAFQGRDPRNVYSGFYWAMQSAKVRPFRPPEFRCRFK